MLQLVFQALQALPENERTKLVHVVCNDTLVEIPQVATMVKGVLEKVDKTAKTLGLPVIATQTNPELDDTFFVNIIGRG